MSELVLKEEKRSFELTEEQKNIINTIYDDNKIIKVNAFSGASKTTSIIEVVKEIRKHDKDCRILYLVFNKSMVEDSKNKFNKLGLDVECYTTHSFALRRFTALKDGEVSVMSNIDYDDYIKIKNTKLKYKYSKYKNILDMFNQYCLTFDDLDKFCENILNRKAKLYRLENNNIKSYEVEFFRDLYEYFISQGKYLHNMYLKEYSVNCHDRISGYKYLCCDEMQDLNPFMLNIIKRIKYEKMWGIGDTHQAIYGWNGAIDALNKINGITLPLSKSFRFNNEICELANKILSLKKNSDFKYGDIKNFHNNTEVENKNKKTVLFRKNITMFEYAVNLIQNEDNIKCTFMDINNGNETNYFDETFGEMLYFYEQLLSAKDVNSEELKEFRSKFKIKKSKNIDTYINIAKKENINFYQYIYNNKSILSLDLIKLFNFFLLNERNIVSVLEKLRNSENNNNPDKEYYLCTAHASKGLEWEYCEIANDDWKINTDEEINLLYVACTRAKNKLDYSAINYLLD